MCIAYICIKKTTFILLGQIIQYPISICLLNQSDKNWTCLSVQNFCQPSSRSDKVFAQPYPNPPNAEENPPVGACYQ